ncbi:MAG: tyrosine-type recombinase/integrase [Planctomycetota bacterium]|nr:tyrosine-type recombinase/integrase [Planctomycetota bacterium]
MPPGAEIIERRGLRVARWVDGNGNVKTAPVSRNGKKVIHEAGCWYARYRDANGRPCRVSTGCEDEQAARKVLSNLLANMEKVKAGIITPTEAKVGEHSDKPLLRHVDDYLVHLEAKRVRGRRVSEHYRRCLRGRLTRIVKECDFYRLGDIARHEVERWLMKAEEADMAAGTRNDYLISILAFCNWAIREHRMMTNPLAGVQKADCSSDRRHVRRALTVDEVAALLQAARLRPVAELGRQSAPLPEEDRCGRSSWTFTTLTPENFDACYQRGLKKLGQDPERLEKLQLLGQERALFYLLAVSTGLRRKELVSLTVGRIHLDAVPRAYIDLSAKDAKSGKGASIPLRQDVVAELRAFFTTRGAELPPGMKLFRRAPRIRVFDADLQAAGIGKTDPRGRVVDIHALRHTFGTHLSTAGVHPRTAMAAMRHSRIELTMNYYTDPVLLDVAGAVEALPDFTGGQVKKSKRAATSTGG